ncbi:aminotransferase class V-fold PLP-dependent enzyme [Falsirhodobacter sp. 20TX0035]|uniref:aminotransferase class V-fold PLP-dependent enzyme n=1 Tax=Falsirhodobacter sp. 20TX0035 TaxID=3022019 RepID=UPI00233013FB|nr:aminotransferase class V-fold PLP-dependent enzyme [Falsirhodobacter sp. 20TX0035]MDB6453023.1 aminotransferase class V-fold PLP-dependent enzyme [Falsirhodobacter sp. 20TX0035]
MTALTDFRHRLTRDDLLDHLRQGLIGDGMAFETPFGTQNLLYADYIASGRALRVVEAFVAEEVLPFYANSHTEASFCGMTMTRMREEGRATIARLVGAGDGCHVIFTGSGATSGINRIVNLLRVADRVRAGERVVVLCGPYEHHSNILPWRETGATMVEVAEAEAGGVDMADLSRALMAAEGADLVIGTFSAASNVTGILTDTEAVTAALKAAGALAIWDYAGGGPYLPMSMEGKDAIVFSAHKFAGGPGASGVLVLRDTVVQRATPTLPGGGSVSFVSPRGHAYSGRVTAREEAGTPNVVGDIRAALVMLVKDAVGTDRIHHREQALRARALSAWSAVPQMEILGKRADALPIFSFRIRDGRGGHVHHQLFTRMLSDMTGIQARGGCACAGPYAHRLMGIDDTASDALFARLTAGEELAKPGWVRLNLSWLHSDAQADRIIAGVAGLAANASALASRYIGDSATARFRVADMAAE